MFAHCDYLKMVRHNLGSALFYTNNSLINRINKILLHCSMIV
ncbi:hypothetical protein A1OE_914 [Candidatus Endolissoclinum faulkneri L2]|uniref:Uncharacterized protein n=1 Tax=Candidatus Endolissoclinum faulkneri L2 TaxID=1193729 RepID=K7Z4X8_9PROT|nr:hypothetical protein A1OE_914 [Candidatus Endolissoclinum faulkneri L2]